MTARQYGPHDPATAPKTVKVLRATNGVRETIEAPLHPAVLKQRRRINELARQASQ